MWHYTKRLHGAVRLGSELHPIRIHSALMKTKEMKTWEEREDKGEVRYLSLSLSLSLRRMVSSHAFLEGYILC